MGRTSETVNGERHNSCHPKATAEMENLGTPYCRPCIRIPVPFSSYACAFSRRCFADGAAGVVVLEELVPIECEVTG